MSEANRTSMALAFERTAQVARRIVARAWPVVVLLISAGCVTTGGAPGRY